MAESGRLQTYTAPVDPDLEIAGDHEEARRRAGAAVHQGQRPRHAGDRQPAVLPGQFREPPSASTSAASANSSAARSAIRSRRCWSSARRRRSMSTPGTSTSAGCCRCCSTPRPTRTLHHRRHRDREGPRHRHLQRLLSPAAAGRDRSHRRSSSTSAGICGSPGSAPRRRAEKLPIVVCIGTDLALQYTAATMGSQMPENADELAVAGGLCGRPLPVVKAVTQDLLVPAETEIVLEGYYVADETIIEGPFGEFVGYWRRPSPRRSSRSRRSRIATSRSITPSTATAARPSCCASTCWRRAC